MITISLCMIVKDEENTLGFCLESVRSAVDEIVIVDTGSADGTKQVARQYTDDIFDFAWIEDFSAARNFAFSKASMDYILWLDADDLLLPEDCARLQAIKGELDEGTDVVMMKYNTGFDSEGNVVFSYFRERLVKRSRHFRWKEPVHEYLAIGGNIIRSDICVTHAKTEPSRNDRNLRIYESMLGKGQSLSPRGMYYYARELRDNGRFADAARQFRAFLDSGLGWVEDNVSACGELAKCYSMTGDKKKEFAAMTESFLYDTPRAELCCQLGYYFKEQEDYRKAAFWFETALHLEKPKDSWGFIQHDCWGYIPSIECAVCCDKLGDYDGAKLFNELAATFRPGSAAVAHNRSYFASRKAQSKTQAEREA